MAKIHDAPRDEPCRNACGREADPDTETFEGYCEECAAEEFDGNYKHDIHEEELE